MKFLVFFLLLTLNVLLTFEQKPLCNPCISFVDEIKKLDQNKGEIKTELENICDKITFHREPFDSSCKKYVDMEVETIAQEINKIGNSTVVCQKYHFC